jgi:hypothetical protein
VAGVSVILACKEHVKMVDRYECVVYMMSGGCVIGP